MEALFIVILIPVLLALLFLSLGFFIFFFAGLALIGSTFAPVIIGIPLGIAVSNAGNVGLGVLLILGSLIAMPFWFLWLSKQGWYRVLAESIFTAIF